MEKTAVKEVLSKVKRINELSNMGFNTPRMIFFPANNKVEEGRLMGWLNKHMPIKLVNIRTYARTDSKESFDSVHITGLNVVDCLEQVQKLTESGLNCIIDAERPADGVLAGSMMMFYDTKKFIIDYCHKPEGGAMVRMAYNPKISTNIRGSLSNCAVISDPRLASIVKLGFYNFTRVYQSVILEFCWMRNRCGRLGHNTIFWEYRNLEKGF